MCGYFGMLVKVRIVKGDMIVGNCSLEELKSEVVKSSFLTSFLLFGTDLVLFWNSK